MPTPATLLRTGKNLGAALFDAGGLAGQLAQVVQVGAADLAHAHDADVVDAGRVDQERSLDADAVGGDAAHGEVLVNAHAAAADDDAFEILQALAATFDNLH